MKRHEEDASRIVKFAMEHSFFAWTLVFCSIVLGVAQVIVWILENS